MDAGSAKAQETAKAEKSSSVEIVWVAPDKCPDESILVKEIEELVGRPLDTVREPSIKATATVQATGDGRWVLRLRTLEANAEGERELVADSCETLAQATALILALSIDPKAVESREKLYDQARKLTKSLSPPPKQNEVTTLEKDVTEEQPPAQPDESPADAESREPAPERQTEPTMESEEKSEIPIGLLFRSGFVADLGTLPDTVIGADLSVGLSVDRVDIVSSINWFGYDQTELSNLPEFGARFSFWTIGFGAYYRFQLDELSLAPFLNFELGTMYAEGTGVLTAFTESTLHLNLMAGARISWEFTNWAALGLEVGPKVPLLRPRYVLDISDDREVVHRSSAVAMKVGIGIELRL
ncbi:MAG: hypothetical protein JXA30_20615 [Deltaproteobacteria bacterium]|nr:hypothetical protein [Deltaproteobacteria bacterium]